MRKRFDEQLLQVRGMLKEMCEVDAEAMRLIERALASREDVSAPVRACERAADEKEREIERLCMRIIVRQQPVAHDLALVTSAVKMVTDLERITDQAADIADIDILKGAVSCAVPNSLGAMMASAREMVERCAAALDTFSLDEARAIRRADDVVDGLFAAVKRELAGMVDEKDEDGECAMDMLMTRARRRPRRQCRGVDRLRRPRRAGISSHHKRQCSRTARCLSLFFGTMNS